MLERGNLKQKEKRAVIVAALKSEARELAPLVRRFLAEKDLVHEALRCIRAFRDSEAADDVAHVVAQVPSESYMAVMALGDIGGPAAIGHLLRMAKASLVSRRQHDIDMHEYAIRGLGDLRVSEAVPDLLELLADPGHRNFRATIIWALARIADERALSPVLATVTEAIEDEDNTHQTMQRPSFCFSALELVKNLGKTSDPRARVFFEMLSFPPIWARLEREDRQLLARLHPAR